MSFFKYIIKDLINSGYQVDYACNDSDIHEELFFKNLGCRKYLISCTRNPLNLENLKAINELRRIVKDGNYDIVHCHTPIVSAVARFALRNFRKKGLKVFYTGHGLHFYNGAPLKNWLVYYPIEKICSKWTDLIITMNQEDYRRAKQKFSARKIVYIPGVGINLEDFEHHKLTDREIKINRAELTSRNVIFLSVGRLAKQKNHVSALRCLASLTDLDWAYVIAGEGPERNKIEQAAVKLGVEDRLVLLGRRQDVIELLQCADIFLFPSLYEGLPVALMEAMASGVPILCSSIRGSRDLVDERCLIDFSDPASVCSKIKDIQRNGFDDCIKMNLEIIQDYTYEKVDKQLMSLYSSL